MIRHAHASPQTLNLERACSDEALPIEWLHKVRRQIVRRGEVRLAPAVLEDAVGCLEGSQELWNFPPRLFRWEAEQWIESRDREPLFSFERICSILHLDAESIRGQIRRWRAHRSHEPPSDLREPSATGGAFLFLAVECRQEPLLKAAPGAGGNEAALRADERLAGWCRSPVWMSGVLSMRGRKSDLTRGER